MSGVTWAVFRARGTLDALEVTTGLAYGPEPAQRYDLWRARRHPGGPRPLVLFFHGGGFQQLDRASHWSFAERFARAGAIVMNADYGLAPVHPYPRAARDAALLHRHAAERAHALGSDASQLIVAGVSAGANLALGLAIAGAEHGLSGAAPRASVLFSGLLQVSDMGRLYRARTVARPLRARMASIGCEYITGGEAFTRPACPDPRLDPLLHLECVAAPAIGFPDTFISTGTRDQVLEDSLRLRNCLARHGAETALDVVPGAGHAFQGLIFRAEVRALWERCFAFLRARGVQLDSARSSGPAS